MATHIEYLKFDDEYNQGMVPVVNSVGYVDLEPRSVLLHLVPTKVVVNYLGIPVTRHKIDGIKINYVPDGKGLNGNMFELLAEDIIKNGNSKLISVNKIIKDLECRITQTSFRKKDLTKEDAKIYSHILNAYGDRRDAEEIYAMATAPKEKPKKRPMAVRLSSKRWP